MPSPATFCVKRSVQRPPAVVDDSHATRLSLGTPINRGEQTSLVNLKGFWAHVRAFLALCKAHSLPIVLMCCSVLIFTLLAP